jgi:dethiobiotin synthetase
MPSRNTHRTRHAGDGRRSSALRVVVAGTGTGVGKTHVACALLAAWGARIRVAGLKPVETGVAMGSAMRTRGDARAKTEVKRGVLGEAAEGRRAGSSRRAWSSEGGASAARQAEAQLRVEVTDQQRLARAADSFHVKRRNSGPSVTRARPVPGPASFHVKHNDMPAGPHAGAPTAPQEALFVFPEPISPHLAARRAGVQIDPRAIDRWVRQHEAPVTIIETAGGLFSPLGNGLTNFDLLRGLCADVVILVAPDRLGVLHELTATLGLAEARGGPEFAVVLSTPPSRDASTGRNAAEITELGIAHPVAVFPRADERAAATIAAARTVIGWIEATRRRQRSRRRPP